MDSCISHRFTKDFLDAQAERRNQPIFWMFYISITFNSFNVFAVIFLNILKDYFELFGIPMDSLNYYGITKKLLMNYYGITRDFIWITNELLRNYYGSNWN